VHQFPGAGAQDRAQHRVEPRQRPVFDQGRRNVGVEAVLIGRHPAHDIGEKRRVGFGQLVALDVLAEPVAGEFAHHRLGVQRRVQFALVERLHRG